MNRIMAEHFGIPPGMKEKLKRGRREETHTENGRSFCHRVPAGRENLAVPPASRVGGRAVEIPAGGPGPQAHEGSLPT